jgi:ADP-ribose pyrophosphatase YjhB (NUDIX family)
MMEKIEHFGVYGLVFNTDNSKILLVKKTRGPYTGLFDLPGGTPEAGESLIQTLYREFLEEVGVKPTKISDWKNLDFKVSKSSTGEAINFHHKASVCPDFRILENKLIVNL